ncbi:hypothetical protein GGF46_003987 [Coemansia sp. RSA 552]|nr:hypothetical protein GGF46_003987 [Coemansia sp. RSA 552]
MADDSSFDLFGEMTPEEQSSLDELHKQRRNCDLSRRSRLDSQRLLYLRSDPSRNEAQGFETLRNAQPMNFGQLFSAPERQSIIDGVDATVRKGGWTLQRHGAFPTRDVPVKTTPVSDMIYERLRNVLFPPLQRHTGISTEYWAFRDLFIVGYHQDHQRSLDAHSDGCLVSLTLLLNDPNEFDGGGTYFEQFDLHIRQAPGDAWIHDGKLQHSGVGITRGKRLVLVAFIDTVGGQTDILSTR